MKGNHSVSVLQGKEKCCYITGRTDSLHKHHVYFGTGLRKISDANGFWVWLIPDLHNMSKNGVHFNKELDLKIKEDCQKKFEADGSTRERFMQLIGRNYL